MVVNEAVNNLMKHSGAGEARLALHADGGTLRVMLEDRGIGFDPSGVPPDRNGLRNIRRRMEALGGRLEIASKPGQGTRVSIAMPILPNPSPTPSAAR